MPVPAHRRRRSTLTPEQRTLRARIAANTRWSHDPHGKANAERAQRGLRAKFRRQVAKEHPGLSPDRLDKLAAAAFRAHMARLSFLGSKKHRGGDADAA